MAQQGLEQTGRRRDVIERFNDFTFKAQAIAALGLAAFNAMGLALIAAGSAAIDKIGGNLYESYKNKRQAKAARHMGQVAVRTA